MAIVALYVSAWIEMIFNVTGTGQGAVALYVSAWIEIILAAINSEEYGTSHST